MKTEKEFILKDLSGRGYAFTINEEDVLEKFRDTEGVDDVNIVEEIMSLELGDKFDLESWCADGEWNATIIIRSK